MQTIINFNKDDFVNYGTLAQVSYTLGCMKIYLTCIVKYARKHLIPNIHFVESQYKLAVQWFLKVYRLYPLCGMV